MFSTVNLIYIAKSKKENKSPTTLEKSSVVKCEIIKSFSDNYYNARGRSIRKSKNIRVNKYHADDIYEKEIRYLLLKAVINGIEYKVDRILNDKYPSKVILDLEEIQ
ncbi:MAG: hypothetical protein RR945_02130 [Erysipelotrichaceae bacterium]